MFINEYIYIHTNQFPSSLSAVSADCTQTKKLYKVKNYINYFDRPYFVEKIMSFQQDQYVTMSIASLGESTLPRRDSRPFQEKKINDISDIDGARSGPKYQHYFNKPQFLQSDVQGSTSKSLSWSRNVRDNSLYIDDIDGTRHSIKDRMMRTSRHVDPLVPAYPLPSYVPAEDPPTKFIKDPLDHSDIDGSYSKPKKQFAPRDTMKIDDIAGTRPKRGYASNFQPYVHLVCIVQYFNVCVIYLYF